MKWINNLIKKISRNKLIRSEIIVIIVCIILGALLHFTYEWSGENKIVAAFSAVNESAWEHLKLAFYPMILIAFIQYFFVKDISNNYLEAKTIGIFATISFITITFFTYTGIIGIRFWALDIIIFVISIILGEIIAYRLMRRKNESTIQTKILASIILIFLLSSFIIFTYKTPHVNLFRDPITGNFGIEEKTL